MIPVSFGHRKRMGKDTAANMMMDILRVTYPNLRIARASFADKIKSIAYDLYKQHGLQPSGYYDQNPEKRNEKLPKLGMTPRELWIKIGTPMFRDMVHQDTWVDYTFQANRMMDVVIISDLRFANEADAVRSHGGINIKVHRDSVAISNDVADCALDNYDGWDWVMNNLSLEATREMLGVIAATKTWSRR